MHKPKVVLSSLFLVLAGSLSTACGASPETKEFQLSDGSVILVEGIGRFYVAPEDRWLLQLTYVSDVPLSDKTALRAQAELVWSRFRHDVEKTDYELAALAISNKEKPSFGIAARAEFRFVLERSGDGGWEWISDRKHQDESEETSD